MCVFVCMYVCVCNALITRLYSSSKLSPDAFLLWISLMAISKTRHVLSGAVCMCACVHVLWACVHVWSEVVCMCVSCAHLV